MIALIFAIFFLILFIFLVIAGGNLLLRKMIDNVIIKKENFQNNEKDYSIVNPKDECKKLDERTYNNLNFQTATNIPLSPIYYKNYIGNIYMNDDTKPKNELTKGKYCLYKSKLLYDGIWNPDIIKNSPYEYETWTLTDGNLTDGIYCSDKLVEVNKPIPDNFIDCSATPPITNAKYYTFFNDTQDDVFDSEISCFPSVFNAGITEDLKKKFNL